MVNGNKELTWEEESLARLNKYKEELKQVEVDIQRLNEQKGYLVKLIESFNNVIELTRQHETISFDSHMLNAENIRRKSIRSSLIDMAKSNNGIVIAVNAIQLLMKAGVYTDIAQARSTVYPTLNRDKNRKGEHFVKERPGVYRLVSGTEVRLPLKV